MIELYPAYTVCQDHNVHRPILTSRTFCFRHPAYAAHDLLFTLPGYDSFEGGLDIQTALLVCGLIAGNRWDGYLSTSRSGHPVERNEILTERNYYFFVPASFGSNDALASASAPHPYRYPIVPCFREWKFPHDRLPPFWNNLSVTNTAPLASTTDAVTRRDVSCRMTDHVEACDVAHLCPRSEEDWFIENDMEVYCRQKRQMSPGVDDAANLLLLRADLHRQFDSPQFIFVPKNDGILVSHVLKASEEARILYHNTALHPVDVAPEFLLTRCAWAIFPFITKFLEKRQPRLLLLASKNIEREASADECFEFSLLASSRSRSASPRKSASPAKRQRQPQEDTYSLEGEDTHSDNHMKPNGIYNGSELAELGHSQTVQLPYNPSIFNNVTIHDQQSTQPPGPYSISQSTPDSSLDGTTSRTYCQDGSNFEDLKERILLNERARSDPKASWLQEQAWLTRILDNGGALDAAEIPRFMSVLGKDIAPEASDLDAM